MTDHDLVIRGATVIDGTGTEGRVADVGCRAGLISAIGSAGAGAEEIDGGGLCLAPGFIDPHTHLDANLFWDADLTPSSGYGVTTVITGNCGYTLAPVDDATRDYVIDVMSVVEAIPRAALVEGVPWDWSTLDEYFARLERVPALMNFATYAGHVAIRAAVMGPAAAHERIATPEEVGRIAALVAQALALGAVGFSTDQVTDNIGPGGTRLPGQVCGDEELLAIAAVLGNGPGPGVFAMAPAALLASDRAVREEDLAWHLRLAQASGRPVVVGPMFDTWSDPGGGRAIINETVTRSGPGARVIPQVSTRPFELWTRLDAPGVLIRSLPSWARAVRDGGADGVRHLIANDDARARVRHEADRMRPTPVFSGRWEHVFLRYSPTHPESEGRTLRDLAAAAANHPVDVLFDLALADDFETQVATAMANAEDEGVAAQLREPGVMIGASDAGAHVQYNTDSCYAVWTLQHWVRERKVVALEQAIKMLTADQADLFGFGDRGRVQLGFAADLVLFDPDRIGTTRVRYVRDQPAQGTRLVTDAVGIVASVVNGGVATREGVSTGARRGRFLR
jgi:N-acyl-D-aspartate/D-glutamate deacylase